ncbi:MAG: glycosyltransferase family 39 protein [Phycisphaerales bacterium]
MPDTGDRAYWSGLGPLAGARGERFCRGPLGALALLAILASVYLPGLFVIPTVDRDEARFAQASRQMFESVALPDDRRDTRPFEQSEAGGITAGAHAGGLVIPMVQTTPRLKKPPLIYWLQSGAAGLATGGDPARDAVWMYRLPSVLAAIVACLATWRLGLSLVDPRGAWLGAVLLGVCPMVVWDTHQARADQALLACTTLAMWALTRLWVTRDQDAKTPWRRWGVPLALWLAIGAGVLVKGPITPMVVVLTALGVGVISDRYAWLKRTRPVLGVIVLVVMVVPWIIAAGERVGWGVLWSSAFGETLGRSAAPREGHWGPPGYHTLFAAVLLWPGSMLTLAAFVRIWRLAVRLPRPEKPGWFTSVRTLWSRWRRRVPGRDAEVFLLAWIVPSWVVFELVATKLPHYTLPVYPALALISAWAVVDAARGVIDSASVARLRLGLRVWGVIGVVLTGAIPVGVSLLGGGWIAIVSAAVAAIVNALLVWRALVSFDAGRVLKAQLLGVLSTVVFAAVFLQFVLPRASALWITSRLASVIDSHEGADRPIASAVYHEDSLVFATRGRVEWISADQIQSWAGAHPRGLLIAPKGDGADLLAQGWRSIAEVWGINYAGGRVVTLEALEREP